MKASLTLLLVAGASLVAAVPPHQDYDSYSDFTTTSDDYHYETDNAVPCQDFTPDAWMNALPQPLQINKQVASTQDEAEEVADYVEPVHVVNPEYDPSDSESTDDNNSEDDDVLVRHRRYVVAQRPSSEAPYGDYEGSVTDTHVTREDELGEVDRGTRFGSGSSTTENNSDEEEEEPLASIKLKKGHKNNGPLLPGKTTKIMLKNYQKTKMSFLLTIKAEESASCGFGTLGSEYVFHKLVGCWLEHKHKAHEMCHHRGNGRKHHAHGNRRNRRQRRDSNAEFDPYTDERQTTASMASEEDFDHHDDHNEGNDTDDGDDSHGHGGLGGRGHHHGRGGRHGGKGHHHEHDYHGVNDMTYGSNKHGRRGHGQPSEGSAEACDSNLRGWVAPESKLVVEYTVPRCGCFVLNAHVTYERQDGGSLVLTPDANSEFLQVFECVDAPQPPSESDEDDADDADDVDLDGIDPRNVIAASDEQDDDGQGARRGPAFNTRAAHRRGDTGRDQDKDDSNEESKEDNDNDRDDDQDDEKDNVYRYEIYEGRKRRAPEGEDQVAETREERRRRRQQQNAQRRADRARERARAEGGDDTNVVAGSAGEDVDQAERRRQRRLQRQQRKQQRRQQQAAADGGNGNGNGNGGGGNRRRGRNNNRRRGGNGEDGEDDAPVSKQEWRRRRALRRQQAAARRQNRAILRSESSVSADSL
ncbi:sarcoplasmic reticulum histidine-rich calcium-binding protein [Hyalella azteca]|uniref:Sarcoplasmic reticulum histidine-rich calcium-binding protein n=1 Tax=Hyalella azteca TaxID=294128 RepID=A0A8B7N336_HYAAZ|nr:sarcoplasmic reticulum histidine-rich calcium-binding protein [Hyalella azteca]